MPKKYTASAIFDIYCEANALKPAEFSELLTRARYLAKNGLLLDGVKVDDRGTYAFPPIEVYRAAIYLELSPLGMDIRAFRPFTDAAARRFSLELEPPASMKIDGATQSRGGLWDSIHGVAC